MSSTAIDLRGSRALWFYQSLIGRKALVATTGAILFTYLLAHLIGNLQIFLGPGRINAYARLLHSAPGPLWAARLVLLVAAGLHAVTAVQLWWLNRHARPVPYRKSATIQATWGARTMIFSGPLIGAFIVYHILHLSVGSAHPDFKELNVYHNVVAGFRDPFAAGAYIAAMLLVGLHLSHGLSSMFQSLGINHPRYTPLIKRFAAGFSFLIAGGNIFIPVAVLTGILK
jgi:succinate dehydrogenase / fumarate reductase, cytochrome b subunit